MDRQMDRWTVNEYMKLEATQKLYTGMCHGRETLISPFCQYYLRKSRVPVFSDTTKELPRSLSVKA